MPDLKRASLFPYKTTLPETETLFSHAAARSDGYMQPGKQKPPKYAGSIQNTCEAQVFLQMPVAAEQHQQADAGSHQQAGEHLPGTQYTLKIQFRYHNRSAAVRNQPGQRGEKYTAGLSLREKSGGVFFPDKLHRQTGCKCNDENKEDNLCRMPESRCQDISFLTAAVILFTQIMDVFFGSRGTDTPPQSCQDINGGTGQDSRYKFAKQKPRDD